MYKSYRNIGIKSEVPILKVLRDIYHSGIHVIGTCRFKFPALTSNEHEIISIEKSIPLTCTLGLYCSTDKSRAFFFYHMLFKEKM